MRTWAVALLVLLAAGMLRLAFVPFSWAGWEYEFCGLHNCYCEPFQDGRFVRQPVTAGSNFGYLAAGVLVWQAGEQRRKKTSSMPRETILAPRWYAGCLLAAGLFSFFSHASLTRVGEWLDLMGVYLLEGTLLALSLSNLVGRQARWPLSMLAAILAAGGVQMALAPQWQQVVIGLLLAGIVVLEIASRLKGREHGQNGYLFLALGLYVPGAVAWAVSGAQGGCLWGTFPGHMIWHLLSAGAAGVLYWYYFPINESINNEEV